MTHVYEECPSNVYVVLSVADVHLALIAIVTGEGGDADRLAFQSAQVDETRHLGAAELWDGNQEDFLTRGT